MTAHFLRVLVVLTLAAFGRIQAATELALSKNPVIQGGIIRVDVVSQDQADRVTGRFSGKELPFIRTPGGSFYCLLGVDMDTRPGDYNLGVDVYLKGKVTDRLRQTIKVVDAEFEVERLTLAPSMVFPDSQAQVRIKRETELLNRKWSIWSESPSWGGSFISPLAGEPKRFGFRRIINGAPRSPHSGVDISAPEGTPVVCPASGKVILTGNFFFSGKSVYIEHGLGLISMFFHLSEIEVSEGQQVGQGQMIGRVGSTGRVTGPHLHWGVRYRNARINPAELLALPLE